ncbi:MAG: tetratricopeptide repeat protein [Desulfamplus sp.]|nr:tetratricopeptide repeat protein [Desulfamplus sp.]
MADRVSNARKKELEQPDPFLESMYRTLENAKKLKKQLLWGGGVVASIICIVFITVYTIRSAETTASVMLSDALKVYDSQKPAEGYDAVKDKFATLLSEYPNTSSGRIGKVRFGEICYAAAQYDIAYDNYISALDDFKTDPVIKNVILSSLGHTCQALKKYNEAEKYFKQITDGDIELMKDDALFNLGIVAIANEESQKGMEYLQKLSSGYQNSMYKVMADEIIARN